MTTTVSPYTDLKFEIRYAVLDSGIIFNQCGPASAGPKGWDSKSIQEREQMAKNWIDAMNKRNDFYNRLEESILKDGFRNPILVRSGWCPPRKVQYLPREMEQDPDKILVCDANGGSRLWVAQKHNLNVPCIISDFNGRFINENMLQSTEEIGGYYNDVPDYIEIIENHGVRVRGVPHYHLDKK